MGVNDPKVVNRLRLTPWEVAFVMICNISFVLTLVNLLIGGVCWCHYPVLVLFCVYFFAFACVSRTLSKFLTRYRNAVFILNIIAGIYNVIYNSMSSGNMNWAMNYFVPINLTVACFVLLTLLFAPTVATRNVLFSTLILLVQSIIQFALMVGGVTGDSRVAYTLISIAFGMNLITVVNIGFIYFIKCKNAVADNFKIWE